MIKDLFLSSKERAKFIYLGLGQKENIDTIESCSTRIRVEVKNLDKIDTMVINQGKVKDILIKGENYLQILIGTKAPEILEEIKQLMH